MKLMATLSNEEVLTACREYVERHHGLKTEGDAILRAEFRGVLCPVNFVEFACAVELPTPTPYRG